MGNAQQLEALRPKLVPGQIQEGAEDFTFTSPGKKIKLPIQALKPFRLMDGQLAFSEILFKVYSEEKTLSFQQIYRMLRHLAAQEILVNSSQVALALERVKKSDFEKVEADYEARVEERVKPSSIDLQSEFLSSEIANKISTSPLFKNIETSRLIRLTEQSKVRRFPKGIYVVSEGARTSNVFVLLTGSVGVFRGKSEGEYLASLFPNSVFGEYAAFLGVERNADVITLEDSDILVINVDHIREESQKVVTNVAGIETEASLYDQLKRNIVLSQTLTTSSLFGNLPMELIQLIIERGQTVMKNQGEVIIREGDIGKSFYIVIDGELTVHKNSKEINRHKAGEFFGEIALIKRMPRSATVRCQRDSILLQITRDDFYSLLSHHLFLALFLEKEAETRLLSN